jgi:hypothetical protein
MTTVQEFAIQQITGGCSTAGLKGLNIQILALLREALPNGLVSCEQSVQIVGGSTLPLLQPAANAALIEAVADKGEKPKLVHAYRTVAHQVVLHQWFNKGKKCGVKLAAPTGSSPHEKGIAIDIQEHTRWIKVLKKHGWKWRGQADPPHFTFIGGGISTNVLKESVRAFQKLWNLHNPGDRIKEDGIFGQTETAPRLLKSPIDGF